MYAEVETWKISRKDAVGMHALHMHGGSTNIVDIYSFDNSRVMFGLKGRE